MDVKPYRLRRNGKIQLKDFDAGDTHGLGKEQVVKDMDVLKNRLAELQDRLFAEKRISLLLVFQGMDCSGKNGVIKHALAHTNPAAYQIHSFKRPTEDEEARDFLWRVHRVVPEKGYIGVFNRSHYEDILVPKIHKQLSEKDIEQRMKHINHFERLLADTGTRIVKFFLHISKEKQLEKLQERLQDKTKMWKFAEADVQERHYWNEYQAAYQTLFETCNSDSAPWYLIPANHRWFRNYLTLSIVVHELAELNPDYPSLPDNMDASVLEGD